MTGPVLLALEDDPAAAALLEQELGKRYGADYRVVCERSAEAALGALRDARDRGEPVALLLADLTLPGLTGVEFLGRAHELHPGARRVVMFDWTDRTASRPTLQAWTLGQLDDWITKPVRAADEHFHQGVTAFLHSWAQEHHPSIEMVQIVGPHRSVRAHGIRDVLSRNGVRYAFHEPDSAPGRALLARALPDREMAAAALPVVVTYDGTVLSDPTNAEIAAALGIPTTGESGTYDVVIVGAGPAGLAAAVYAASEGLRTALLEQEAIGGQASTSSLIRNYLGFPRGVTGAELAVRAAQQVAMFGCRLVYARATGITAAGAEHVVMLAGDTRITTRAVVVATGVSYRRLGIPSLEKLVGVGVFYGAAAAEARGVQDTHVYVVGGANSAGQAAVHLARYAARVTLLVRGPDVRATMSDYLVRRVEAAATIEVRHRTEVVGATGEGRLTGVVLRDRATGRTSTEPAAALFVLIGAEPHTGWLPAQVQRDGHGYVRTGRDVEPPPAGSPPELFETSLPGVFAVGDVRHGSVKRVASAVGEGAVAVRLLHDHLARLAAGAPPDRPA